MSEPRERPDTTLPEADPHDDYIPGEGGVTPDLVDRIVFAKTSALLPIVDEHEILAQLGDLLCALVGGSAA